MILEKSKCGLTCEPEAYKQLEDNIKWFINNATSIELSNMGKRGREYLEENLSKNAAITKYKKEILGEYEKEIEAEDTSDMLLEKEQF